MITRTAPEKEAFQRLARDHLSALYTTAQRLVGDDAEDLVQETLLRAYRSFDTLKVPGAARGWLRAILLNVFRDHLRKRGRSTEEVSVEDVEEFSLYRVIADEDPFPYSDTLHLDFLAAFGRDDVRRVLLRLPVIYRAPLVLHYVEGYSTKEIARLVDAPLGTVLARLHRGRKLFEKEMWNYAEENGLLHEEAIT